MVTTELVCTARRSDAGGRIILVTAYNGDVPHRGRTLSVYTERYTASNVWDSMPNYAELYQFDGEG